MPSGHTPNDLVDKLRIRISELVNIAYDCLNDILPRLESENIVIYNSKNIPKSYINKLRDIFHKKFFLIITPMAVDQSRPFPFLAGKSLNLLVNLMDPATNEKKYAIIPIPANKRFIKISDDTEHKYIYIEEFFKLFLDSIFKGYKIIETCSFRITRDAELTIDEEDSVDLLAAIEDQLKQRPKGTPIRLEIESGADKVLADYLYEKIKFYDGYLFPIKGPLDLTSFFEISSIDDFAHLKDPKLFPVIPAEFNDIKKSVFELIGKKDRLIHHPFESFDPVIRFIKEASEDEKVLAIKITLYRTSYRSPIVDALKRAAENGKQVTVLVELKARFDEAQNINWAKQLEKAGCHVVYGLVGLKIHSKMTLVVREEENGIKQYVHLSTGNYNENTAKLYTDIGLFTAKKSFGMDISSIFNLLTGFSEPPRWKKIVCAPLDLRNFFLEKIEQEIKNVKSGGSGKIIAKINSLIDIKLIKALYKASNNGVKIQLIVRGMCRLRPEVRGMSENISVISIVDRFLEHSRIYYFYNSGEEALYLSSADWMERNLDRRIEISFPVEDSNLKQNLTNYLKIALNDNTKARILNKDGRYTPIKRNKKSTINNCQNDYYKYINESNKKPYKKKDVNFIPKTNPGIS